jgi:ligand-binding sensor domain-containing protein
MAQNNVIILVAGEMEGLSNQPPPNPKPLTPYPESRISILESPEKNFTTFVIIAKSKILFLIVLSLLIVACTGKLKESSYKDAQEVEETKQPIALNQNATFPQIHTNLNGMVREFVRTIYQDKKGNYWFGTNGDGIIRYDGRTLEKLSIPDISPFFRVMEIIEDNAGNIWFATSEGLIKYDGLRFRIFSSKEGLPGVNPEIWSLMIDRNGMIWVGAVGGVCQFNGEKFIPFSLPASEVENGSPMLSEKLVFKILEDKNGNMWFAMDGHGIMQYINGAFIQLTTKNGLTDNSVADILEDKKGNIWIGTFNGGVSRYDGKSFTNFTSDGIIEGAEAYNFYEDRQGNIWFTAEGYGVYRYDGNIFKQFTTADGLTSNVTLSILQDNKGQMWFGSWQGLSIYDGQTFTNAREKEQWTN